MNKQIIWQRAVKLAASSHRNQLRKDGRTPYFSHPVRVALTLEHVFGMHDDTILAAALLHDVIEDTTCDYDEVMECCGEEVAKLVAALSKDKRIPGKERELAYARQIANSDWRVRLIKLADVYDNLCDAADTGINVNVRTHAQEALDASRGMTELKQAAQIVTALMEELNEQRQSC